MPVDTALLRKAADLKGELLAFARRPRYERIFDEVLAAYPEVAVSGSYEQMVVLLDYFVLEHRLASGRRVVEQFVRARGDLPAADRAIVGAWADVVHGPFEVLSRSGDTVTALNLVDDLTYRIRATAGPKPLEAVVAGSFLLARIVPLADEWLLTGMSSVLPPDSEDEALVLAFDRALKAPEAVYRNPEKLARAWDIQAVDRARFVEYFGTDVLVLPGAEVQERMNGYYAHMHRSTAPGADSEAAPDAMVDLPPELLASNGVGVIYDERDGLGYYGRFGEVCAAFEDPALVERPTYCALVRGYLDDNTVEPSVLTRLAGADCDRASALFRRLLRKPTFDWARDGEALLRRRKSAYYARPILPKVSPVSDRLSEAWRRSRRASRG
jgi:hypothetical protein